jgi:hypothetical protein
VRLATGSFFPITLGTLHLTGGAGGGGGGCAEPTVNSPFIWVACGSQMNL